MKLHAFRVLTNENVHPEVVAFLRGRGLDVATATEAMLRGAEDVAVLRRRLPRIAWFSPTTPTSGVWRLRQGRRS